MKVKNLALKFYVNYEAYFRTLDFTSPQGKC